jgi:hypothetical protein
MRRRDERFLLSFSIKATPANSKSKSTIALQCEEGFLSPGYSSNPSSFYAARRLAAALAAFEAGETGTTV